MGSPKGTIEAIDTGIGAMAQLLPFLLMFFPQLRPYLAAIQATVTAVDTVAHSLPGVSTVQAAAVVTDHVTPGAPNSPALDPSADPFHHGG